MIIWIFCGWKIMAIDKLVIIIEYKVTAYLHHYNYCEDLKVSSLQ